MAEITFMIGNGFDLNCGLKSKFTDTYEGYIEHNKNKDSNTIKKFKRIIDKNIENWADFELALARYAKDFQSKEEIIECIRDYKAYLYEYLQKEQEQFWSKNNKLLQSQNSILKEIGRSLARFYCDLKPYDVDNISPCFHDKSVNYHFINFNYTDIFDKLIESAFNQGMVSAYLKSAKTDPKSIHIHGKLGEDLILGLDNTEQLSELPYKFTEDTEMEIIKPSFLKIYDNVRLRVTKEILDQSIVICLFGLSLQDSDMSWRKMLARWLSSEYHAHHLVFFTQDNMNKKYHPSAKTQMIEDENKCKRDYINLLYGESVSKEIEHRVFPRLHFPVGTRIFDFGEEFSNNEKA